MNLLTPCFAAGLLLLSVPTLAGNCTPDTITLTLQIEVDNFQINHGADCDTVVSGLTIEGVSIVDLTPLLGITTVSTVGPFGSETRLQTNNTVLTSLAGLENLANVF